MHLGTLEQALKTHFELSIASKGHNAFGVFAVSGRRGKRVNEDWYTCYRCLHHGERKDS